MKVAYQQASAQRQDTQLTIQRENRLRKNQLGLSLIELIITLAITSIIMSVFFQSLSGWQRISERVNQAAVGATLGTLEIRQFRHVTQGLVSAWPEEEDAIFRGNVASFTGLTRNTLHKELPSLEPVRLSLLFYNDTQKTALVYQADGVEWVLTEFSTPGLRFLYLGADGAWVEQWPPAQNPKPQHTSFDDQIYFGIPQLPEAISVVGPDVFWISSIATNAALATRQKDVFGVF